MKKWKTKIEVGKEQEDRNALACTNKNNQIKRMKGEIISKQEIILPKRSTYQKNYFLGIKLIFYSAC